MFDQASKMFDQYPSIAQMLQMAFDFQVRSKFSPPALEAPKQREEPRETPWPISVELYVKSLVNPQPGETMNFFEKFVQLSEEEIEDLKTLYIARDFENPRAKEIIGDRWGQTTAQMLSDLVKMIGRKRK